MSDWDAYFWEPGGTVLRNRLGLHDEKALREATYAIVAQRMSEIRVGHAVIPHTFDATHLCAIHRHLFQDVFDWAGEYRTVEMGRVDTPFFASVATIDDELRSMSRTVSRINWECSDLPDVVHALADIAGDVNYAHPFRDGNGRAQKVFFNHVVEQSDFSLDFSQVKPREWNYAFQRSMPGGNGQPRSSLPLYDLFSRLTGTTNASSTPLLTNPYEIDFTAVAEGPSHWLEL